MKGDQIATGKGAWICDKALPDFVVPWVGEDQAHVEGRDRPNEGAPPAGEPLTAVGEVQGKGKKQSGDDAGAKSFKGDPKNNAFRRARECANGGGGGVDGDRHHQPSKRPGRRRTFPPNPGRKGNTARHQRSQAQNCKVRMITKKHLSVICR